MRERASVLVIALVVFFPVMTVAQEKSAVDITREDINTVLESMGRSIDRQLKVVDIGVGNVAVGILHRTGDNDTDGRADDFRGSGRGGVGGSTRVFGVAERGYDSTRDVSESGGP